MREIKDIIPITAKRLGIPEEELARHVKQYEKDLKDALANKPYLEYDFYFLGKLRYMKNPLKKVIKNFSNKGFDVEHYKKVLKLFDIDYEIKRKRWNKSSE